MRVAYRSTESLSELATLRSGFRLRRKTLQPGATSSPQFWGVTCSAEDVLPRELQERQVQAQARTRTDLDDWTVEKIQPHRERTKAQIRDRFSLELLRGALSSRR